MIQRCSIGGWVLSGAIVLGAIWTLTGPTVCLGATAGPPDLPGCASDWSRKAVEMEGHRRSGAVSMWLDNGVRFHHMKLDLPPGQVFVTINFVGGELLETAENRGISLAATKAWDAASIRGADADEIKRLMAEHDVRIEGASTPDAMQLRVWGNREDIEYGMRVASALMLHPLATASVNERASHDCERVGAARERTDQGLIASAVSAVLFPSPEVEPRTAPPCTERLRALPTESIQKWLDWHVQSAPVEAAIVGDISLEQAAKLMAGYLGQLPARARIHPGALEQSRKLPPPHQPLERVLAGPRWCRVGDDVSLVVVGFLGGEATNPSELRTLRVAARVLDQRVAARLREAGLGGSGIGASAVPATVYPGFGAVLFSAKVAKADAERAADLMSEVIRAATETGVGEDEVDRAGEELARSVETYEREPRYWSGILARATTLGLDPDELAEGATYYRALPASAVDRALRANATAERMIRVLVSGAPG